MDLDFETWKVIILLCFILKFIHKIDGIVFSRLFLMLLQSDSPIRLD